VNLGNTVMINQRATTAEAGLSQEELRLIVFKKIIAMGGVAQMKDLYPAVEERMNGNKLSKQGQDSLRENVNRKWVREGYIYAYERNNPGWRITDKGRKLVVNSVSLIHIENQDMNDVEIDQAIRDNRLCIGVVETDTDIAISRRRKGQERVRELTLSNYSNRCAICEISCISLLVASHVVGWAENPEFRGILSNVICLCRFHDVLFEHGYFAFTDDYRILKKKQDSSQTIDMLLDNIQFRKPIDFYPQAKFLRHHRQRFGFETTYD